MAQAKPRGRLTYKIEKGAGMRVEYFIIGVVILLIVICVGSR